MPVYGVVFDAVITTVASSHSSSFLPLSLYLFFAHSHTILAKYLLIRINQFGDESTDARSVHLVCERCYANQALKSNWKLL